MAKLRLARKISNVLLIVVLVAVVTGEIVTRAPGILEHWRNLARVRQAERALDRGDRCLGLQLLARAGQPGEERVGRLLVACHNKRHWPGLVASLRSCTPQTRDALARAMGRSPEERLCAAEALAAVGDERGIRALASSLSRPSAFAHDPADLLDLGNPGCEALANVARFGSPQARERALLLLSDAQVPETKRALVRLLGDRHLSHADLVLRALAADPDPELDILFETFLADRDPQIRAEAVRQHGLRKGPEALRALTGALDDESAHVRLAAVEALGTIGTPEASRVLVQALSDSDPRVVRQAVCSLGRRRAREAAPAVAGLYEGGSRELKQEVATALSWMESPLAPTYRELWERETGQQLVLSSAWDG